MNKHLKRILLSVSVIVFLYASMIIVDYSLSVKAKAPVFARSINASDVDIYRGIGYTIIIDDGYAIAPPDAELKGYFHWGWR